MAIKKNECPNCGANVKPNNSGLNKCEYCGSILTIESQEKLKTQQTTFANVLHNVESSIFHSAVSSSKRPKRKGGIVTLLVIFTFGIGCIFYNLYISHAQRLWDQKHNK